MKRIILPFALGLAAGAPGAWSQPASAAPVAMAPEPSLSFVVTPAVVSQYMFRGVRSGGLSFEPTIEADYGNLAVGVWMNTPIRDKVPGQSDPEIDPYGSYTFNLSGALSVQPGFTVYSYMRAPLDQGFYHATFEPSLAVNYTLRGVRLTPKLYYTFVLEGPTYELNASSAVPLAELGTELDFTATGGTFSHKNVVNGATPKVKNWGNYWLLGVAAPFTISRSAKLSVGFAYTAGSGNYVRQGSASKVKNAAAIGRGVFTLSYAWTF
jgi:hypothetical protein